MSYLSPAQREAVGHPAHIMLTACPGSGKTRTLVAKLVAEIEDLRESASAVACITYTNTAVQEIEQRARTQLQPGDERYYRVSTIHAFCLHEVLAPFGWVSADWSGKLRILTRDSPDFESICAHAASQVHLYRLDARDYEAFEGLNVNSRGELVGPATQNAAVARAAPHFWARCRALGYIDFCSIIYGAYVLLRDVPHIARSLCARYRWILVDEFQDTSELQIEILNLLSQTRRSRVFAVGDLAQSIMGFAGARPELVDTFAASIGARTDIALAENFRSSSRIVDHANRLIARAPPMVAVGPDRDYPAEPRLIRGGSTLQAVVDHFLPALADNRIALGEATVLAPDWGSLYTLSRGLRGKAIPVVGPGARPYRRVRLFAQLAEQLCGALTDPHADSTRQLERALFHMLQDATGQVPSDVFSFTGRVTLVRLMNEARRLAAESTQAVPWLDQMSVSAGEILYAQGYLDWAQSQLLYASVQEMKADIVRQHVNLAALRVEDLGLFASPTRALKLSTIHFSKGREYKGVAIIGLRQGTLPHFRETDVASARRLFYVAVTRARQVLMYVAEQDQWNNPPSAFLGSGGLRLV